MNNNETNPGAVIIDGHGRADLGVVRALGERGVPVYLLTNDRSSPVALSRFVTAVFKYPSPKAPDSERIAALIELGRRFTHKPVFFSTGDSSLVLFSRHRQQLERYYRHHISSPELVEGLYDKIRFARVANERGLEVPMTHVPRDIAELEAALPRFSFPVIVKPAEKRRWDEHAEIHQLTGGNLKGVRLDTPAALLDFYRKVAHHDTGMVVQDYIQGRDEAIYSLHAYVGRDGRLLGSFTGQKLRTYPVHRGIGCFQLSVYEPGVIEVGERALKALGYTGHAVVQMKRVPGTDAFKIFEINCRYSSWNYLHTRAGVNLPYAAYLDSLQQEQEALPRQRENVRWIDAANDIRALADYRRLGEWTLLDWARTYFGKNCYAFFAWNDPLPAAVAPARSLARIVGYPVRLARRLRREQAGVARG
jgi:D-aspartate ligase